MLKENRPNMPLFPTILYQNRVFDLPNWRFAGLALG